MFLRRFQVQGFKNFRRAVALEDLGPFNVIHGDNNAGKSNLIEAIGLFFVLIEELFDVPPPVAPQGARPEFDRMFRSLIEAYEQTVGEDGGAQPWQRRREVDRRVLERRGHPAREIFHLHEPAPIELTGSIGLASLATYHDRVIASLDIDEATRESLRIASDTPLRFQF